jgi:hypothetical protein
VRISRWTFNGFLADAVFVACEIELARDHFPPKNCFQNGDVKSGELIFVFVTLFNETTTFFVEKIKILQETTEVMPRYPLNFDNMMYFVEIFNINDSKIHIFVPPCNIVYLIEPRKAYKPFKNVCVRAHLMS